MAEAGYSTVAAKQGKKVRMLAVASEERLPAFPNVPTFKELGYNIVSELIEDMHFQNLLQNQLLKNGLTEL